MIKFRCGGCQQKIGVPASYAGKRVRCPGCGNPVAVPGPEPETKTKPPAPPPEPSSSAPETAAPSDDRLHLKIENQEGAAEDRREPETGPAGEAPEDFWMYDVLNSSRGTAAAEEEEAADADNHFTCPKCQTTVRDISRPCPTCGHSFEPDLSAVMGEVAAQDRPSYGKDLLRLLTPIRNIGDGVTFFILLMMSVFVSLRLPGSLLLASCCLVLVGKLIVLGVIYGYMFNLMLETANGNNDLPGLTELPTSFWETIRPYFLFIASVFYSAFLALVILVAYLFLRDGSTDLGDDPVFKIILIFTFLTGLFCWPMVILTLALGDSFFIRMDKLIQSIFRSIGPYLICCLSLYVSAFLIYLSIAVQSMSETFGGGFVTAVSSQIGGLCVLIYAMRAIGLFYRHYQDRIDW